MYISGLITTILITHSIAYGESIILPRPDLEGKSTFESILSKRRSEREFSTEELSRDQIGQLLWSAQGITQNKWGFRTAPSAGALYPLEIYVVLKSGVYHYFPAPHKLERIAEGDKRHELSKAALGQASVQNAPAVFVIGGVYERTTYKYGDRGARYVHMEAGHACQNLLLQATSINLVGVPIGAFHDERVLDVLQLNKSINPLFLVPIGYPKK